MPYPRFPLPEEGYFSLRQRDPKPSEAFWLMQVQRTLRIRWGYKHVSPTGRMDASTSAAICKVQETIGHKPNGELDEETWNTIFEGNPV